MGINMGLFTHIQGVSTIMSILDINIDIIITLNTNTDITIARLLDSITHRTDVEFYRRLKTGKCWK